MSGAGVSASLPTGPRGKALAVGLVGVALGLVWLAVAAPLLAWHADRAELLAQRQALATRMEAVAATLPQLRADAEGAAASPAAQALLQGATDAVAGAALQGQVETMASGAGMTVSSLELLPTEAAGAFRRVGLRLSVNGSWPSLLRLLQAVDEARPRMVVDDVQVQPLASVAVAEAQGFAATFTVIAFRAGAQ